MSISRNVSPLVLIKSDKDTHFTEARIQNAQETESVSLPADITANRYHELYIESISIQADQNLEWDVYFWSSDEFDNTDLDLDAALFVVNFPATAQKQIAGAGQYRIDDLVGMPYPIPTDNKIHISLCNRSDTAKNAGATGEVVIKLFVRPVR
ncbi:MAG: hypothetical protein WA066_07595 [Candidatus Omnitrophota bacterium]